MTTMKRVEIVVDADELSTVCTILDRAGVSGYTLIPQATGKGDRGDRSRDELAGTIKNGYIFCACTEPQARAVADAVRGVLQRVGGVCLINDCVWVEH
jgi:nitrogen regulatory protein PII